LIEKLLKQKNNSKSRADAIVHSNFHREFFCHMCWVLGHNRKCKRANQKNRRYSRWSIETSFCWTTTWGRKNFIRLQYLKGIDTQFSPKINRRRRLATKKLILCGLRKCKSELQYAHLERTLRDTAKNQAVKLLSNVLSALSVTRQSSYLRNSRAYYD